MSQYLAVSPVKSTKCKFANLIVSRKIASRPTNLVGLTRTKQGNPDSSDGFHEFTLAKNCAIRDLKLDARNGSSVTDIDNDVHTHMIKMI